MSGHSSRGAESQKSVPALQTDRRSWFVIVLSLTVVPWRLMILSIHRSVIDLSRYNIKRQIGKSIKHGLLALAWHKFGYSLFPVCHVIIEILKAY